MKKKIKKSDVPKNEFWETLKKCEAEVKKWPAWKRNIKLSHEY